jgi:hypothetical protein
MLLSCLYYLDVYGSLPLAFALPTPPSSFLESYTIIVITVIYARKMFMKLTPGLVGSDVENMFSLPGLIYFVPQ